MKQILQKMKSGETEVAEVPCPSVTPGHLLIRTRASLISAGTERMLVEFGKAGWIEKARQQPDKVRQVLDKIRTDGLLPTLEAVQAKLDQPIPLGYSNVGVVEVLGAGVEGFSVGDRVVSNGPHAEMVSVPKNLCARIPNGVSDDEAAFTVLGAIALQGARLAQPTLGERFVVMGLGLIGLLAVQILQAHGCRVLGIDPDPTRRALARQFGAETRGLGTEDDPVPAALAFSGGQGVDGALIAAATQSSQPVHQAARMCRKRGRIVLVGVTGLDLHRADFYEKELSFQVSCSYGPGRYDPEYEEKGHDYPLGYVRWTEQRNLEAVLELMALGRLQVGPLISATVPIERASEAYSRLLQGGALGLVITYAVPEGSAKEAAAQRTIALPPSRAGHASADPVVGVIGAGNFTGQV